MLCFAIFVGNLVFFFFDAELMPVFDLLEGLVIDSHFVGVDGVRDTGDSKRMAFDLVSEIKVDVEDTR